MYCRAVRQRVVGFGDEKGHFLCAILLGCESGEISNPNHAESCDDLDFFSSLKKKISLIADGPHYYHPACGHKGSSHLSPVHALQFFIAMQV